MKSHLVSETDKQNTICIEIFNKVIKISAKNRRLHRNILTLTYELLETAGSDLLRRAFWLVALVCNICIPLDYIYILLSIIIQRE